MDIAANNQEHNTKARSLLVRNRHPDFALRQPLYRLFQGSSEDTGLSLLMRSPEDAVDGPILDKRYICCNLQQEKVHLAKVWQVTC